MREFLAEGNNWGTEQNNKFLQNEESLTALIGTKQVVEAICTYCDEKHNMHVDLNGLEGIIAYDDGAIKADEGKTKTIALLSRVGKPVSFYVMGKDEVNDKVVFKLSRRAVQEDCFENYIKKLEKGRVIDAKVTHLANFGAFVDVGVGIASLIPIDRLSVSRISSPSDRFVVGQDVKAVVLGFEDGKLLLSHKELLGTWQENADMFEAGSTVVGIARSIESYGIFVELAPNLAGLAEVKEGIKKGQAVSVCIKSIIPEKCKVKLIVVDAVEKPEKNDIKYFITEGVLKEWSYTPENSPKKIKTVFQDV